MFTMESSQDVRQVSLMDEIELRLAAVELFRIEVAAWLDPGALDDAAHSIRAGLGRGDADEDTIRHGALQLIDDARRRYRAPAQGSAIGSR